jgi:serine O-acetyltransferase
VLTWLNVILFGIEFTPKCEVGAGLMLPHTSGTVVGALKIGSNVTIFQGVTLGAKFADIGFTPDSRPVVGNNVMFGAGAKVLGGITVGDGAVIAANSLVVESVAPGATMIGIPAIDRSVER